MMHSPIINTNNHNTKTQLDHTKERITSGAINTRQSAIISGIYLHGSNIPDLSSMDSMPTRPQLNKTQTTMMTVAGISTGNHANSTQLNTNKVYSKSRSKQTFQNVGPKVQSRNFIKQNGTRESSQKVNQVMTSLDDKFKTEKMDLTISQQNTLRQEQSQMQKDKQLHSDRLTKVTNNTMQLQNDQTFSGHASFDINQAGGVMINNAMDNSPQIPANKRLGISTLNGSGLQSNNNPILKSINIDGQNNEQSWYNQPIINQITVLPDDQTTPSNLILVTNEDQQSQGTKQNNQQIQHYSNANPQNIDQINIKRIVLTQNQLNYPESNENSPKVQKQINAKRKNKNQHQIKNVRTLESMQSHTNKKQKNSQNLKINKLNSNQNSPSIPGVTEYLNDSEFVEMFMKPKGIEIFNPDLLSSEKASRRHPNNNYINYQNYQSVNKIKSSNKKPLDPSEIEQQSSLFTQSHVIDSSVVQSRQLNQEESNPLNKKEYSINNVNNIIQLTNNDQKALKRFQTINPKKKAPKVIKYNEAIDIDEMHYTEISSNANSMDKSEILKQQKFTTQKTQLTQIADPETKSLKIIDKKQIEKIPLFNQDLKERQRQIMEQEQQLGTEMSCDPATEVNHAEFNTKKRIIQDKVDSAVSMTEVAEKDLKISEKKYTESQEINEHRSSTNKNRQAADKLQQQLLLQTILASSTPADMQIDSGEIQQKHQSQLTKKVELFKETQQLSKKKSRLSYQQSNEQCTMSLDTAQKSKKRDKNQSHHSKHPNLNLGNNAQQNKHHQQSHENKKQKMSSIATPCSKDEITEKQNSKAFSAAMISENLLDINDLNNNYMQIDEMFSNSQDLTNNGLGSLKHDAGLLLGQTADYLDDGGKPGRYRPIHQINVQLLSSASNDKDGPSNQLNKSSCYEMRNSKQRDVGIQLSWQNSQMNNYHQDRQSNCKSDGTARQNESYQKDMGSLIGGPKFSPPTSGISKTTNKIQTSLNATPVDQKDLINLQLQNQANNTQHSSVFKASDHPSSIMEIDFVDSMAKIQKQNALSMQKMKMFFEGIRRKQLLFEMLHAQRRRLFKSPNPNDRVKILVGDDFEIEADTLLNGNIHNFDAKKRSRDLGISTLDQQSMLRNNLMRQRCFSEQNKQFLMKGNNFDPNDIKNQKSYEFVFKKAIQNFNLRQNNKKKNKSPEARINDSRLMLQQQLKNLPLIQLQKIHEILTVGGIIVQQEKPNQKSQNSPCYQYLLENQNESYIKIKFKSDDKTQKGKLPGQKDKFVNLNMSQAACQNLKVAEKSTTSANNEDNNLKGAINTTFGKYNVKKLNISEIPLNIKINKDYINPESKTTTKLSEEDLIREAIVNKILSEEKNIKQNKIDTACGHGLSEDLVAHQASVKEPKQKKSVNVYQEGQSIIEDIQANITETITDNEQHFIQYQEVGSINNMFHPKFDQSRECSARQQYNQQQKVNQAIGGEDSSSPFQNQTQSITTPGSMGVVLNEYTIPKVQEESTLDYRDNKNVDQKKSLKTLGRIRIDKQRDHTNVDSEPVSAIPITHNYKDGPNARPFENLSMKLKNRNLSVLSKPNNANKSLNFMDEDQTDNQTIYLGQRAASHAFGPTIPSALATITTNGYLPNQIGNQAQVNHHKQLSLMLQGPLNNQDSRNHLEMHNNMASIVNDEYSCSIQNTLMVDKTKQIIRVSSSTLSKGRDSGLKKNLSANTDERDIDQNWTQPANQVNLNDDNQVCNYFPMGISNRVKQQSSVDQSHSTAQGQKGSKNGQNVVQSISPGQHLSKNDLNHQYQSFGRIVPQVQAMMLSGNSAAVSTPENDAVDTMLQTNNTQQKINSLPQESQERKQLASYQPNKLNPNIKTGGGKTSMTALVDHDAVNEEDQGVPDSGKAYTHFSYHIDDDEGDEVNQQQTQTQQMHLEGFQSTKNIKVVGNSIQDSQDQLSDNKLFIKSLNQKHLKCETNRQTQELFMNNSSTINDKLVNRSKNSVTYKRLNEDLDIELQKTNMEIQYEDMLSSSLKEPNQTKSSYVQNRLKLKVSSGNRATHGIDRGQQNGTANTANDTLNQPQVVHTIENINTIGSNKNSNTLLLADLSSPQQFNPKIYNMKRYSHEDRKSLDYIEMSKNDRNDSDGNNRSRNQEEYNRIQKMTAEIQISRRTNFNQSNATPFDHSSNSYINTDIVNHTMLSNTIKGPHCAKYLQSTQSNRPKSQGIMGSQRLGKKILHQNFANYELYMQLKQMQNVGRQIGVQAAGCDNNSSEPTIRDQGTTTQGFTGQLEDTNINKINFPTSLIVDSKRKHSIISQQYLQKLSHQSTIRKTSITVSVGPTTYKNDTLASAQRSSHLFQQVSQKMKEAFVRKNNQNKYKTSKSGQNSKYHGPVKDSISQNRGWGTRPVISEPQIVTSSDATKNQVKQKIQNYKVTANSGHHRRFNTLSVEFVKENCSFNQESSNYNRDHNVKQTTIASIEPSTIPHSPQMSLSNTLENRPFSTSTYYDQVCLSNDLKLQNFKEKMDQNSLYQQYFDPACRLINKQRFLNKFNQLNQNDQSRKAGQLHINGLSSGKNRPKVNVLKVVTPNFMAGKSSIITLLNQQVVS